MIQPLHSPKNQWVLDWVHFDEPVRFEGGVYLPTCLFVLREGGEPVIGQEILRELDHRRAENLLARLFSDYGTPDEVVMADTPEWEPDAWKAFAKEMGCAIRVLAKEEKRLPPLLAMTRRVRAQMAHRLFESVRAETAKESPAALAEGLCAGANAMRSQERRVAMLQKAVQLDAHCAAAWIGLADIAYTDGSFKNALDQYRKVTELEAGRWIAEVPLWWSDSATRPYLRGLYGTMLVEWHLGRFEEALRPAELLLQLNPADNQGTRFFIPMLHLLSEHPEEALKFFEWYEKRYPRDYSEPSFLFGWGLTCGLFDDEAKAHAKYRAAMLRNVFMAPLLLDLPEPPRDVWYPNDRSEPGYADEFFDSYGLLWERDTSQLRILREVWQRIQPEIEAVSNLRRRMADYQDQRYDPGHQQTWAALLAEEKKILGEE